MIQVSLLGRSPGLKCGKVHMVAKLSGLESILADDNECVAELVYHPLKFPNVVFFGGGGSNRCSYYPGFEPTIRAWN